ncbi:hypothetical protein B0H19DRAFT_1270032 [Mycena capillaripes]|nr:hypothetical protein B0H19DRAFT_1270032 [Mycena capillaripes]
MTSLDISNILPWTARFKKQRLEALKLRSEGRTAERVHPYLLHPTIDEPDRDFRKEFGRFTVLPASFIDKHHRFRAPRTLYGFCCPFADAIRALTKLGVPGVDNTNIPACSRVSLSTLYGAGSIPSRAFAIVAAILGKLDDLEHPDAFPYNFITCTSWLWNPIPPSEVSLATDIMLKRIYILITISSPD